MEICFKSIGVIHTSWTALEGMPIQPSGASGAEGIIELYPEFSQGLDDIEGFSYLYLLYMFHKSSGYKLKVKPFLDKTPRGLFSTRAPKRPNPIGLSIVRLVKREDHKLVVADIDVLDQTPLIDIKPWVPGFDSREDARSGWLEKQQKRAENVKSDDRFVKSSKSPD